MKTIIKSVPQNAHFTNIFSEKVTFKKSDTSLEVFSIPALNWKEMCFT